MSTGVSFFTHTCVVLSPTNKAAAVGAQIDNVVANFHAPQTSTRSSSIEHRCDNVSIAPTKRKTCTAALDDFLASGAQCVTFCFIFQGRGPIAGPHFSHSVFLQVDRSGASVMIQSLPPCCRGTDVHLYKDRFDRGQTHQLMQITDDVVDGINVALNLSRITRVECPQPLVDDCIDVLILSRYEHAT